ncbi:MAG: hypothetical protein LC663_01185 [Actinobacteria bacterium]|nr:hypothetical protein [Actinomycetota bacterium]
MRGVKAALLIGSIVVAAMGFAHAADSCGTTDTVPATTAAGTTKSDCGDITCGMHGNLPVSLGGVLVSANQTADGGEVEACNDHGAVPQGRAVVQVSKNTDHAGARVVLDTDDNEPVDPGYINVQASNSKPGVWCNRQAQDGGTAEATKTADGYYHQWDNPGTTGGLGAEAANCVPEH